MGSHLQLARFELSLHPEPVGSRVEAGRKGQAPPAYAQHEGQRPAVADLVQQPDAQDERQHSAQPLALDDRHQDRRRALPSKRQLFALELLEVELQPKDVGLEETAQWDGDAAGELVEEHDHVVTVAPGEEQSCCAEAHAHALAHCEGVVESASELGVLEAGAERLHESELAVDAEEDEGGVEENGPQVLHGEEGEGLAEDHEGESGARENELLEGEARLPDEVENVDVDDQHRDHPADCYPKADVPGGVAQRLVLASEAGVHHWGRCPHRQLEKYLDRGVLPDSQAQKSTQVWPQQVADGLAGFREEESPQKKDKEQKVGERGRDERYFSADFDALDDGSDAEADAEDVEKVDMGLEGAGLVDGGSEVEDLLVEVALVEGVCGVGVPDPGQGGLEAVEQVDEGVGQYPVVVSRHRQTYEHCESPAAPKLRVQPLPEPQVRGLRGLPQQRLQLQQRRAQQHQGQEIGDEEDAASVFVEEVGKPPEGAEPGETAEEGEEVLPMRVEVLPGVVLLPRGAGQVSLPQPAHQSLLHLIT